MKHECRYRDACKYGGVVDTDGRYAWSTNGTQWWHYLCALKDQTKEDRVQLYIPESSANWLKGYILSEFPNFEERPEEATKILELL